MPSSYLNNFNYLNLFDTITYLKKPNLIIEFGILYGDSLQSFADNSSRNCKIYGYDIFDDFVGNHAEKEKIIKKFENYQNITIDYGNFFEIYNDIPNNIDILHIDIANDGNTYDFMFKNYMKKMNRDGIIIMEGGSKERDLCEWMKKYEKPSINNVLVNCQYNYKIIGEFPSMTIFQV